MSQSQGDEIEKLLCEFVARMDRELNQLAKGLGVVRKRCFLRFSGTGLCVMTWQTTIKPFEVTSMGVSFGTKVFNETFRS